MSFWIQTLTGNKFDFDDLDSNIFDPNEIGELLSRESRFVNHTIWPYSVAQHSVLCSRHLPLRAKDSHREYFPNVYAAQIRLWALLHDVAEAFTGDVSQPLKRWLLSAGCGEFRRLEQAIDLWVLTKHRLPTNDNWDGLELVKQADLSALATERRDLMVPCRHEWSPLPDPWKDSIEPWHQGYAADCWIREYRELCGVLNLAINFK